MHDIGPVFSVAAKYINNNYHEGKKRIHIHNGCL